MIQYDCIDTVVSSHTQFENAVTQLNLTEGRQSPWQFWDERFLNFNTSVKVAFKKWAAF